MEDHRQQQLQYYNQSAYSHARSTAHLYELRKSVAWEGQGPLLPRSTTKQRLSVLQERLEEVRVLELHKGGGKRYLKISLRKLYKHVLTAIANQDDAADADPLGLTEHSLRGDPMHAAETPLTENHKRILDGASLDTINSQGGSVLNGEDGGSIHSSATTAQMTQASDIEEGKMTASSDDSSSLFMPKKAPPLSSPSLTQVYRASGLAEMNGLSSTGSRMQPTYDSSKSEISPRAASLLAGKAQGRAIGLAAIGEGNGDDGSSTILRRERVGGYLYPRDMRRLLTPFSASNEPEVIVRRHVMLLNFDPLRAIILRDRILVLVPHGEKSILAKLEAKIRGGTISFFNKGSLAASTTKNSINNAMRALLKRGGTILSKLNGELNDDSSVNSQEKMSLYASATEIPPSVGGAELADDSFGSDIDDMDDEDWAEVGGREWMELAFELKCLDAVLQCVSETLSEDTTELQEAAVMYMERVIDSGHHLQADDCIVIRAVKNAIREMISRVTGFVESIEKTINDEENMALMNLSRLLTHPERFVQPVPPEVLHEESDEPELILEAHLQVGMSLGNVLDLLQGQIESTSELLDRQLDATRNKILFANMILTVVALSLALVSVIGSIFGMNLWNHHETDSWTFLIVTIASVIGAMCFGTGIMVALFYSGTVPTSGVSVGGGHGG